MADKNNMKNNVLLMTKQKITTCDNNAVMHNSECTVHSYTNTTRIVSANTDPGD